MTLLHIGLSLSPTWLRGHAWRRPDSRVEDLFTADFFVEAARAAEAAHLDFLFKPDALTLDPASVEHGLGFSALDSTMLMTALVRETTRIGLVPTVSSTFAHPFTTARQLQSLDRLSAGRAGWNVVTSLGGSENFADRDAPEDRYANAVDFVTVVEGLRQSFPARALRHDRETGVFADPAALSPVPPRGRYASAGPLGVPALSDEPLPMLHAGGSPASVEFAARYADAVFAMTAEASDGIALRGRLHAGAQTAGRERAPLVLPGVSLCLAPTRAQAEELANENQPGTSPTHVQHWTIVGTPQDAVDEILRRADAGAIDGVIALPAAWWGSLHLFTSEVVPALAAAGRFRTAYRGTTLRMHLAEES
ncbi:LLM class flavin-dependent oxidoreductase [Micromonospora sp. NPDC003197]